MDKPLQVLSFSATATMDQNKKNQKDLRQRDSLKSASLWRPRSTGSGTTTPDPERRLGEFEPTETEECTETDFGDSSHAIAIVATQVGEEENSSKEQLQLQQQRQRRRRHQLLPIVPPFRDTPRARDLQTSSEAVGTVHSKRTSSTTQTLLSSVQELTDLLHEANQDNTVYRNKRRNRRVPAVVDVNADNLHVDDAKKKTSSNSLTPCPHLLKIDDMTSVLKHINMAEEANRPIRWDLIGDMTAVVYGESRHPPKYIAHDTESTDCDDATTSIESTSREILAMMLAKDESACSDWENASDADGYPLNPSAYTCASSVTWWDGSNYEEIEISDDECDFNEDIVEDDENKNSRISLAFEGECASFMRQMRFL